MVEAAEFSDRSNRACEGKKESRLTPRKGLLPCARGLLLTKMRQLEGEEGSCGGGNKSSVSQGPVLEVTFVCSFSHSPNSSLLAGGL